MEIYNKLIENRFELVLLAARRGKELNHGAESKVQYKSGDKKRKESIVALQEIAQDLINIKDLKNSMAKNNVLVNTVDDSRKQNIQGDAKNNEDKVIKENLFFNEEDIKE